MAEDWSKPSGAKSTKQAANYRDGNPSECCGVCSMFHLPHTCTAVAGRIDTAKLCDYFDHK